MVSSQVVGMSCAVTPRAAVALVAPDGHGTGTVPGVPRAFSAPARPGHAVLSRGVEEQAGPASPAARRTPGAYRPVVGREPAAAVSAPCRPDPEPPAGRAQEAAEASPGAERTDRPLPDEVTADAAPLDRFTDIWRGSTS
ncbi:hypothetical protein ACFCYX_27405 [Streptomyces populi]|uniref:hypothetical protein n=1 Tax=Streptomyces populi TaxID=2058924 RepID=UPI0013A69839